MNRYATAMASRFITFEGGEGAGKSTQVKLLAERLLQAGIALVQTAEPGGTPIAMGIRRILLSDAARALNPDDEAVLFAAARADHVRRVIRPALDRGDWVVCDRFFDSTRAYQGSAGVDAATLDAWEREAVGATRPDLTLLLDLSPETGLARVAARAGRADRFERDALGIHRRRRAAFLAIATAEPHRVAVISADRPAADVSADVWQAVATRLLPVKA